VSDVAQAWIAIFATAVACAVAAHLWTPNFAKAVGLSTSIATAAVTAFTLLTYEADRASNMEAFFWSYVVPFVTLFVSLPVGMGVRAVQAAQRRKATGGRLRP
jgi:hypothetical protein